jgi:2-(1,2-epoxy-1,2-dihydrophenyl)acetyl-CoA isomerase
LYFLAERVSAVECKQLGIANYVYRADQLEEQTMTLARRLAAGPPVAYRYMKENLNRAAMGADVIECLDLEVTHHADAALTDDHREAAQAFVEKREPVFKGR